MKQSKNALHVTRELILMTRTITWEIMRRREHFNKEQLLKTNAFISEVMDSIHNFPSFILENDDYLIINEYKFVKELEEKMEKINHMDSYKNVKRQLEILLENDLYND